LKRTRSRKRSSFQSFEPFDRYARSNRLQKQNVELRSSGILEMRDRRYRAGFSGAMHREVEQAGGTYALRESSKGYGSEFAQENEALTGNHDPVAEIC
jgi:hypothetical protein